VSLGGDRPPPRRRGHRRTPSMAQAADFNFVMPVFRKFANRGELSESGCKQFFDAVFGEIPSKRGPQATKRFVALRTFVQHAKSENASTIKKSVVTERSLRAYLMKDGGKELTNFSDQIGERLGSQDLQTCIDDFTKENNQTLTNMKPQKSNDRFECDTCGQQFDDWDLCQSHLIKLDHMGARKSMRGLKKRCRKQFQKMQKERKACKEVSKVQQSRTKRAPELKKKIKTSNLETKEVEESGFICCQCESHFETWAECRAHLKELNHMGANDRMKGLRRKCRRRYDTFSLEERGYRCLDCAETFNNWRDCKIHLSSTMHAGTIQRCRHFFEEWSNENAI